MSIAHVSGHTVVVPGQPNKLRLDQTGPRSSRKAPTTVALGTSRSDGEAVDITQPNNRLEPIDKNALSLSVLRQYNDIVGEDTGLTCRSLPPVKLSLKLSKTKFVDTPRGEASSRILKPLLTMKTHAVGHHVFTEGISKKSKIPNPAFALPKLKVPYSNLPDSVMIYKEKNKFTFGVRNETNRTPYRLTPKPTETPGVQLHVTLPNETPRVEASRDRRQIMSDRSVPAHAQQLKSNKVVLDPIFNVTGNENDKTGSSTSNSTPPAKEPYVPCNSVLGNESPQRRSVRRNSQSDNGDRRLSVISIGDTVTQNYFERHKRQTRKLYPMYDHKSRRDEYVKKAKFGGNYEYGSLKPEEREPSFTYKVSSRNLDFSRSESTGTVSPIKNNIRNRPPPLLSSSRGLGSYRRYAKDSGDYDNDATYQDAKFRRLYRRMYAHPRSADSNSSGEMSIIPANPPPSEISHIISEDIPQNFADFRNEMRTLMEEREKTQSLFSARLSEKGGEEASRDEDKTFINIEKVLNDSALETGRSDANETDTDIEMEAVMSKMVDERGFVKEETLPEQPEPIAAVANNLPTLEQQVDQNETQCSPDKDIKGKRDEKDEPKGKMATLKPSANTAPKQLLSVPTFSLDKLSHHPYGQNVKERTSLSRSIQNLALGPDTKPREADIVIDVDKDSMDADKLSSTKDSKMAVPVTKLRLFSECSTVSVISPRLSLTDEHGEMFDINQYDETAKPSTPINEKRLVTNSNIHFISPLVSDNKAKRQ